ncbi:MAG: lipase family protein [Rectinema sp.]
MLHTMQESVPALARIVRAVRDFFYPEPTESGYRKEDLSVHGFPVDMGKIALATALEASVYDSDEKEILARWGKRFDSVFVKEIPEVENRYALFTHRRSRRQYVVIRGTANLSNLMHDLQFLKKTDPGLKIGTHEGFMKLARAVHADLAPRLLPGYRLHLVGHSLGAAEAVLLGMILVEEGRDVYRIITLGQPKVTDTEGWEAHRSLPVVRVVTPFDPVPFLPPKSLLYREKPYTHGSELLMLLDGNRTAAVPSSLYDDMTSALMDAWGSGKRFDIPDHQIENYMARIEAKKNGIEPVDAKKWLDYATPTDIKLDTLGLIKEWIRGSKAGT